MLDCRHWHPALRAALDELWNRWYLQRRRVGLCRLVLRQFVLFGSVESLICRVFFVCAESCLPLHVCTQYYSIIPVAADNLTGVVERVNEFFYVIHLVWENHKRTMQFVSFCLKETVRFTSHEHKRQMFSATQYVCVCGFLDHLHNSRIIHSNFYVRSGQQSSNQVKQMFTTCSNIQYFV